MAEAKFNAGRNEADEIPEVIADPLMNHYVDGVTLGDEESDGVGKLQLSALPGVIRGRAPKIARSKR